MENCFDSILLEQIIEKNIPTCDVKLLVLEVINNNKYQIETKCQILSKIVSLTKFDINSYDKDTHPLIRLCAYDQNLKLIMFLVENMGANINVSNNQFKTPIENAIDYGSREIIKYLYEKRSKVISSGKQQG